ncbi:MAG TPA: ATP-grasp domain-containing protein, partial [Xanthobacteraceae bacterium]
VRLGTGLAGGMQDAELLDALDRLAAGAAPCGLVWGTGFEDRPNLLARLAERWPLLGNTADTVKLVKDPMRFAELCASLDVAHPETRLSRPTNLAGWLRKRQGGAGGSHIRRADASAEGSGFYYQREVAGTPVAALFLAHGGEAVVLGCSTQWCDPTPLQPYRYGGAVRPAPLPPAMHSRLADAVQRLAAALPLVGLNSADFLLDGSDVWLLEVNPRPGATLDIFEPPHQSLFALHVAACGGDLPVRAPSLAGAAASAIVYAQLNIPRLRATHWPDWVSDRPHAGPPIRAGEPLCTVHAIAATAAEAKKLVSERLAAMQALTQASAA